MTVDTPSNTIYINNLNEKVKTAELKQALAAMFAQFGEILEVVAKKTLRCRGQAWIAFKDMSSASQAIEAMQGFEFYDKPMRITFSKAKSDVVAKQEGAFVPRPKLAKGEKRRRDTAAGKYAHTQKQQLQHMQHPAYMQGPPPGMEAYGAPPGMGAPSGPPPGFGAPQNQWQPPPGLAPSGPPQGWGAPSAGAPPSAQQQPSAPPGENPPNHILLLVSLPEESSHDMLTTLFSQYPGLREVRLIPGRHDIAFVEYGTEDQAATAKSSLQGFLITPQHPLKVMFAKKGGA